jgi:hypothetical protein
MCAYVYLSTIGSAVILVERLDSFEPFVEYMFRRPVKDIVRFVGIYYFSFEEMKKMNVMIPEIHEKMWTERLIN